MTSIILNFVRNHWLGVLVGILIAGAAATIEIQRIEIEHLNSKIATLTADNITLTNNNSVLTGALNAQNAAVSSLQAQADAKQRAAATQLAAAEKRAQKYEDRFTRIRAQKMTKDDCQNMKNTVDLYFSKASQ